MPTALTKPLYKNVMRYTGDAGVPNDVARFRKLNQELMRRMGTPVLLKKMFNIDDVNEGVAELSPNMDTTYDQPIHDDPLSYGVGYVSVEKARGEWLGPGSEEDSRPLTVAPTRPGPEWERAPLYRGYGPGYLTYVILPDAPVDVFKLTEEGAFIKTQQARIQLPWYPTVSDNDLMICVELDASDRIINSYDRYQLKQVNPITMRGLDRWGRREINVPAGGNRLYVGQFCEASLVPELDPVYLVETDR